MRPSASQLPTHALKADPLQAELFRTLGHPARVRALRVRDGEMTVGALQDS